MGLYLKEETERTELQKRVAKNLDDKSKKAHDILESPDFVDDSAYMKDMKKSSNALWLFVLLLFIVLAVIIFCFEW